MTDIVTYIRALQGPILVTGASGFVGANLFFMIHAQRKDVFACVKREKGWRLASVADEFIIEADLTDISETRNLVSSIQPRTILDCTAYGAYSFEKDFRLIYQTNFQAIINLISEIGDRPFAAFVHAGSSSEYGSNCAGPLESDLCIPNSDYAASKVAIAGYLRYAGKHRAFPCANLRLYSVYGPLEDTSRLIPNLVAKALAGTYPPFVSPDISRDFVYVDDVCEAFVKAAVKMNPGIYGEDFNIGSGTKTTIGELAAIAREKFSISEAPRFDSMPGRAWDLSDWFSNPSKAREILDWQARMPLADGLQCTAQWISGLSTTDLHSHTKAHAPQGRSISAIVACYRDAQAIPIMHERLTAVFHKIGIPYEIIFVNDGSPDNSAEVIRSISEKDSAVLGITHSRNFGSQMAFRSGMELCSKNAVVLLDGDLQDPPELIEQFYNKMEEGWDVVYGRRVKREMSLFWGLMYKGFYRVFAAFSYIPIPRDAGDFSLMDRRVISWLLNCPERDLFLRGLRAYVGFRQTGVDYIRPERMFGVSTNNLLKNIDWAKKGIFSFSDTPLAILTAAGVVLLSFSILVALIMAVLRILYPDIAAHGITTVMITTLFFGSLNLFAIGLVGEYVAKIMSEVKARPRLIRSSLIRDGKAIELLPDGKAG